MSSGNRGLNLLLAAVLVAFGIGKVRGETGAAPPRPPPRLEPAQDTGGETSTAGFDAGQGETRKSASACLARAKLAAPAPGCRGGQDLLESYRALYQGNASAGTFRFMLAMVPDPEESGHTDYFDAVFEGVEDAVAAGMTSFWKPGDTKTRHYVRDRHFLPWPGSNTEARRNRCWETTPGVVLYRPLENPTTEPALAVLLVGETPTWGVREKQLAAALCWIDDERLGEAAVAKTQDEARARPAKSRWYRVLGPTFSGTAPSLAAAIHGHEQRLRQGDDATDVELAFRIASGTATGTNVRSTLESVDTPGRLDVEYRSAMPDDTALLGAMKTFLADASGGQHPPSRDAVVLSESLTAYGENVSSGGEVRQLRFPPNLASLRRAYTDIDTTGEAMQPTRAPSTARAAPEERRGELSDQSPIAHDLALAEVLRELNRRQYRQVGIVATDARDVIFMAKRIKLQLADVQLFTLGFDIRYLHPDHARFLNGMLVAHAAPSGPPGSSTALRNPMTRGVSDAGRHLLTGTTLAPRARVSLIGNGVLWQMGPDQPKPKFAPALIVPHSFQLVYWASLLLSAVVLLLVTGPTLVNRFARLQAVPAVVKRSGFLRQRTSFWAQLGNCEHLDLAADHAFATASLLTISFSVPVVLAAAAYRLNPRPMVGAITGLLVAAAWLLTWYRTRSHWKAAGRDALALGVIAAMVALFATSLGCAEPRETTVNLLSGGSPLVGGLLGLGMLLVVVWCWRARVRLLDTLRFGALPGARFFAQMKLPIAQALGAPEHSELGELERRLLLVLRSPWFASPLIPLLVNGLLLGTIGFVVLTKAPLTFEAGFRHFVLIFFVIACILPITNSFARIVVTARALMRLLRSTATAFDLGALRKLPPELARRLETQLAEGGREVGELTHPVATLTRLGEELPALTPTANACQKDLDDELAYQAGAPATQGEAAHEHGPAKLADRLLETASALPTKEANANARALIEEYRARLVAIFVARYVRHLRLPVPPVVIGSALAVLMTSLYFVQPQHMIGTICFVWVTGMVIAIVAVYAALARDPVISAIGGTAAGSVTPSFTLIGRAIGVALVPLSSLVASQYPEFAYWVSSVLGAIGRIVE